jgi:hypothetical protein
LNAGFNDKFRGLPMRLVHRARYLTVIPLIVAVRAVAGGHLVTAAAQQPTPNNMFTAAGFVVQYADTPAKQAHLRRLPPDKLVTRTRGGKVYYVYADPTICRCAYVGTPAAYQAFQNGPDAPQFGGGGGDSRGQQMIDEMSVEDSPSEPGAPSFDDYVFGGMRDD